jgi:hypothetical protein
MKLEGWELWSRWRLISDKEWLIKPSKPEIALQEVLATARRPAFVANFSLITL